MIVSYDGKQRLNFPTDVQAFDVRLRLQTGNWNVLAEYAQKSQDPSQDNDYIYRKGYVAMLSASYSKRGMSFLVQAKRSDNMSFRSQRTLPSLSENSSFINHLPAFTMLLPHVIHMPRSPMANGLTRPSWLTTSSAIRSSEVSMARRSS